MESFRKELKELVQMNHTERDLVELFHRYFPDGLEGGDFSPVLEENLVPNIYLEKMMKMGFIKMDDPDYPEGTYSWTFEMKFPVLPDPGFNADQLIEMFSDSFFENHLKGYFKKTKHRLYLETQNDIQEMGLYLKNNPQDTVMGLHMIIDWSISSYGVLSVEEWGNTSVISWIEKDYPAFFQTLMVWTFS